MVALDTKYHVICLVTLYCKAKMFKKSGKCESEEDERIRQGVAIAEPIAYID